MDDFAPDCSPDVECVTARDRLRSLLLPAVLVAALASTWAMAYAHSLDAEASRGYYPAVRSEPARHARRAADPVPNGHPRTTGAGVL